MTDEIKKLKEELATHEQMIAISKAKVKEINLKIRQLNTLQKKVDKVLGNFKGDEIKVTS